MGKKPTPDEILSDLEPFLVETYRILDAAAASSARDFEIRKREPEIFHFSSGLRNEAKHRFEELSALGKFPCELVSLNLNGLQVVHRGYALRFRKADRKKGVKNRGKNHQGTDLSDFGLPKARPQSAMDKYYGQTPLPFVWPEGVDLPEEWADINLVILWLPDAALQSLEGAVIGEPAQGQSLRWWKPLPHPMTHQNAASDPDFDVDDLEYELEDDSVAADEEEN